MSVTEEKFSQKFEAAATGPKARGAFYQEEAAEKGLALVEAKHRDMKLYWLVDPQEDRVYSAKFFAYGGKVSIGICETLSQMVKGLTLEEACSLTGEDVERALRDEPDVPAVPESKRALFDNVEVLLKTILENYPSAKGLAAASASVKENGDGRSTFKELSLAEKAWLSLSEAEQIQQLDLVLDEKVRPALMNDGGNIQVLEVVDGEKVIVQYQGACGSCGSSLGATLSFIEQALRQDVYPELQVVPNL
ncbi:MAG: NifU family protein [Nitrospinaceae bacterium]